VTGINAKLRQVGVDQEGGHILAADMSGAITDEDFASSGSGSPITYGVLESVYNKEITNEQNKLPLRLLQQQQWNETLNQEMV
jgi:20S proteasome alpha/beta subunit